VNSIALEAFRNVGTEDSDAIIETNKNSQKTIGYVQGIHLAKLLSQGGSGLFVWSTPPYEGWSSWPFAIDRGRNI